MQATITLIVDASSYLHAYWAGTGGQSNPGRALQRICHEFSRKHSADAITVFDPAEGTTWRHRIFPTYKAGRQPKPESLLDAIAEAKAIAGQDGTLGPEFHEHEADDVIAYCVQRVLDQGGRAVVLSRDKDMHQLLEAGRVTILKEARAVGSGAYDWTYYTAADLLKAEQLRPDQWPDYRAIMGDASDAWKGAPGLGEVKAKRILQAAGSLPRAMETMDALPLSTREKMALRSFEWKLGLELMTLRRRIEAEAVA